MQGAPAHCGKCGTFFFSSQFMVGTAGTVTGITISNFEVSCAYSNEAGRVSRSYVGHTFQLDRGHRSNLIAAR